MRSHAVKSLCVILCLIILALASAPFFIGQYAKTQIVQIINQTNSPFELHAQIISYENGWFSSRVRMRIYLANYSGTTLTGDIRVHHGPFVHFTDWRQQKIWYAAPFLAYGNFKINDPKLSLLLRNELPQDIYIVIHKNFMGDNFIRINSPEILFNMGPWHTTIGGLTLHIARTAQRNHITINAMLNDVKLDAPTLLTRLNFQYIALHSEMERANESLWTGFTTATCPQINLLNRLGSANLINTKLDMRTDEKNPLNLFNVSLNINKINLKDATIGPLNINGYLKHFYDEDLGNFVNAQKFMGEMNVPDDLREQALNPFITQLLQGVTGHINQGELKLNSGTLQLQTNFAFPPTNANMYPLPSIGNMFQNSLLDLKLMIPRNALKLNQPNANLLQATLLSFYNQGWLSTQNDGYLLQIQHSPNGFIINNKPWPFVEGQ